MERERKENDERKLVDKSTYKQQDFDRYKVQCLPYAKCHTQYPSMYPPSSSAAVGLHHARTLQAWRLQGAQY